MGPDVTNPDWHAKGCYHWYHLTWIALWTNIFVVEFIKVVIPPGEKPYLLLPLT